MQKQKGFTLIEGLLIVLIMLVIGFGGWYVYSQSQDNDTYTSSSSVDSGSNNAAEKNSSGSPSDLSQEQVNNTAQKILKIPEFGIKVTYQLQDDELTYAPQEGSEKWVTLSSRVLEDLSPVTEQYKCQASEMGTGVVGYFTDPNQPIEEGQSKTIIEQYPDALKVGDRYYYLQHNYQTSCYVGDYDGVDEAPEAHSREDAAQEAIKTAKLSAL